MEVNALDKVLMQNRSTPLLLGSVKPNTGHSEASAALFSIAKALVAIETGQIPANIHYETPNKNIPALVKGTIKVPTENTKYNGGLIAVNGFGLSMSIGHIVLKPNRKVKKEITENKTNLLIASTRTEQGIKEIIEFVKSQPVIDPEYIALAQCAFSKSINSHLYRGYAVLDDNVEGQEGSEVSTYIAFGVQQ